MNDHDLDAINPICDMISSELAILSSVLISMRDDLMEEIEEQDSMEGVEKVLTIGMKEIEDFSLNELNEIKTRVKNRLGPCKPSHL